MSNNFEEDKFGFAENKRIYDEECARLAKQAKDMLADNLRKSIPELREKLKVQEDWMKANGYSI